MKEKLPAYLKNAGKNFGGIKPKVLSPPKRSNKKKTPRKDLEAAVQKECLAYLRGLGILAYRQNAGRVKMGEYYIILAPPGASDIIGILPTGIMLCVECKRRYGGVQSEDQKRFQRAIERNNGVYILAHSVEELEKDLTPHMDYL